ncbi:MAG: Gfo/Idh/MocA family oxidoreductase [Bacteroidetes bacterium]|nr:Gfo/Idh/MocA family oxidoreductase [Bacteroidota bacterium]
MNKIALVGLGHIGKIHLKILNDNPNWELVGVYDTDNRLCKELAAHYNIKAFSSLQETIDNCDVLDIVTPNNTHFEIAKTAMVNGKHIFIEQPVTTTIKEAKQLQNYINESGVCFQVGQVELFNPAFIAAKPYLLEPKFIEVHRLAQYNNRGTDVSVVLDLMLHDLELILYIVRSNVKRISASGGAFVSKTADIVNARIEFENGTVANITTNRIAFKNTRKFRVFAKDHFVSLDLLNKSTEVVKLKNAPLNSKNLILDPGNGLAKKEVVFEHPIILPTNAINEELNALHTSINSNKKAIVGIEDALRALELALEIEEKLKL